MGRKHEATKKTQEAVSNLTEGFKKILDEHGFADHQLTKFSIVPTGEPLLMANVLNCPPNFHKEWICRTVNGVTSCGWQCVKDT